MDSIWTRRANARARPAPSRSQKRISGPLLDRIDIHVEAPRIEYEKLTDKREGERLVEVRGRVRAARERQTRRFTSAARVTCNAATAVCAQRVDAFRDRSAQFRPG